MLLGLIPPNCMHESILDGTINLLLPWQLRDLPTDFIQQALTSYTILDNGAAEGSTAGLNELDSLLTKYFDPEGAGEIDELVLPDKLQDCEATRTFVLEAGSLGPLMSWHNDAGVKFMAVAQGKDLAEVMSCVNLYQELDYVDVIGLPRCLNQQFTKQSRLRLSESLNDDPNYTKPIHCLGSYYHFPREMQSLKWIPQVRSMDTSLPWVYGWQGRFVDGMISSREIARPEDYFNVEYDSVQRRTSERNVNICLRWAKAHSG